ncbi:spore protease YyaC [Cohnella suwonensis]|uniref:Spore protease YyaC n=1 Tax=Cohnella suwonensis TaxID=696072 RepID=A0ABW0LUH2_9BACL
MNGGMADKTALAGERVDETGLRSFSESIAIWHGMAEITFLCIGTDRSTGDCLGPLVGTMLAERGVPNVVGTLKEPCDSERLPRLLPELAEAGAIFAVDACLGRPEHVGGYVVRRGPLVPAQSVGRGFGPIGDYSVAAVVNAVSPKPYWTLQSTSLYGVMGMARAIADAICDGFGHERQSQSGEEEV